MATHEKEFEPARWQAPAQSPAWMTVYEDIEGIHCAVTIQKATEPSGTASALVFSSNGEAWYNIFAQTRTVQVTPEKDHEGFARWVETNGNGLVHLLGPGTHWGMWWGPAYGLDHRHFTLFNSARWDEDSLSSIPGLTVATPIHSGPYDPYVLEMLSNELYEDGSTLVEDYEAKALLVFNHSHEAYERHPIAPSPINSPCPCGMTYSV